MCSLPSFTPVPASWDLKHFSLRLQFRASHSLQYKHSWEEPFGLTSHLHLPGNVLIRNTAAPQADGESRIEKGVEGGESIQNAVSVASRPSWGGVQITKPVPTEMLVIIALF